MIKVKILNPTEGRNEITFRPFLQMRQMLYDCSIDLTESDDYDFLFVGMHDFLDKSKLDDINCYGVYCSEFVPDNEIWLQVKYDETLNYKYYTDTNKTSRKLMSNIKSRKRKFYE